LQQGPSYEPRGWIQVYVHNFLKRKKKDIILTKKIFFKNKNQVSGVFILFFSTRTDPGLESTNSRVKRLKCL
jgi:hypothetical protein